MQALTTTTSNVPATYNKEQIELIKQTVARGATDDELKYFLYVAQKRGLDPLVKQIYFQKRKNYKTGREDVVFITGIDGFRLTADRTGKYAGNDDPVFDDEGRPSKATVTVYKIVGSQRCAFTASARWDQYYPGDKVPGLWNKMPHLMLGKCAEALALRKAFPENLSGLYIREEMEQAGPAIFDAQPEPPTDPVPQALEPPAPTMPPRKLGYDGSPKQAEILRKTLLVKKIPDDLWPDIEAGMIGLNFHRLDSVIKTVTDAYEAHQKAQDAAAEVF